MKRIGYIVCCLLFASLHLSARERHLEEAYAFLGVPYVAGTLECEGAERLVIDTMRLDCTTFVELSVARWLAQCDGISWEQHVQKLRYRGGVVDGYLSRLHYFTDWVAENERRGIWYEVTCDGTTYWKSDTLTLSYMSDHFDSYPYLRANAWAIDSMRIIEQRYADDVVCYIGKEYLNLPPAQLPIQHGDILALVTTIDGLDVTHIGFAIWKDEQLHLMHASMKEKRVVVDKQTLYEYLKNRTSCPGVRVVRLR